MTSSSSRSVRIFLSSTFRDFGEERDLLVRRVFPRLRSRLRDRLVDLVDVDLRWGITVEQAERGEVLPICLAEIDRARPFFVGMLGERYGWVPPADAYSIELLEQHRWLEGHRGDKSVTELEILHGVLNDTEMAGRAFFYFRSPEYSNAKGGDYVASSDEDTKRQADLKDKIRKSDFPVVEDYPSPEAFAERLEEDLWAVLDEMFPEDEVPDAFERESRKHDAYALPRRKLYLGGEHYASVLTGYIDGKQQRVLIEGQSGGGKSALIANWLQAYRKIRPDLVVHEHYLAASVDAADPASLVRRMIEKIKRVTDGTEEIPGDLQKLYDSLPFWLANASAWGSKEGRDWVFVFDALNNLNDLKDLRFFPEFLPEHVHFVVSCLSGEVYEALFAKGNWARLSVEPLDRKESRVLLKEYLKRYNKTLPPELEAKALSHPLATNPLFLRTLAEELRLLGVHEELSLQLDHYLTSQTLDELFERVLERVESDCGEEIVRSTLSAIWGSRFGLSEKEIMGISNLKPLEWAPIRFALEEALLESGGGLTFAHDYVRIAVSDRYLAGKGMLDNEVQGKDAINARRALHTRLAEWFEDQFTEAKNHNKQSRKIDKKNENKTFPGSSNYAELIAKPEGEYFVTPARAAEEIPYQWQKTRNWLRLKHNLTTREVFKAIYDNRSNEEHLSYWLDLEHEAGADLEKDYQEAWENWSINNDGNDIGNVASKLVRFLSFAGRYKDFSCRLASLALTSIESANGLEHLSTAKELNSYGYLLQAKGDYDAAEDLYRRALKIVKNIHGADHLETGSCLNNLAWLLQIKGEYKNAKNLYSESLVIVEKFLGHNDIMTAVCLNNISKIMQDTGEYDDAEMLALRSLAIIEKVKGSYHQWTGSCLHSLARIYLAKGNYDAAEPFFRRALLISEKILGKRHPETSIYLNNLARMLQEKGDYDAAEKIFREALAIAETVQGPEHPSTSAKLYNLARLLSAKGDYSAAEHLYNRALTISEKVLGLNHPWTGSYLSSLGKLFQLKGDNDAAEPLLRRALEIAEITNGYDHPSNASTLNNLAKILQDRGDYDGAEFHYICALEISEKYFGPMHQWTAMYKTNLGRLFQIRGNYEAAETTFKKCLDIQFSTLPKNNNNINDAIENLALLYDEIGKNNVAETLRNTKIF